LIALAIILALLALFLLLPVGADVSFIGGELVLKAKAGPVKLQLIPGKPKKPGEGKKKEKVEKVKPPKKKKTAEEKIKSKITKDDVFTLLRILFKALGRLRRALSIDVLMLHLSVAAPDPFDAISQYGYINAGIGGLYPLIHKAVKIRKEDIATEIDLNSDKIKADVRLVATFQIWEILHLALCAAFAFICWFIKRRRRNRRELKTRAAANA